MKWAALVVGLRIAASVAWFAAEQHYDNCIQDARKDFDRLLERAAKGGPKQTEG